MKLILSQIIFLCLWIKMMTRMGRHKPKNNIKQECILNNCDCDDCFSTNVACELNKSSGRYLFHFHSIQENKNQILVKRYIKKKKKKQGTDQGKDQGTDQGKDQGTDQKEDQEEDQEKNKKKDQEEYVRCDVKTSKGKKELKCKNTTRQRQWTLPQDITQKILYVIRRC